MSEISDEATCQPPFRQDKVHVLSEKCSTCVFHPGNRMRLRPGVLAQMVKEALANEPAITCHQTLPYGGYGAIEQAVCRGFYDLHASRSASLRLATWLGRKVDQEPPRVSDSTAEARPDIDAIR